MQNKAGRQNAPLWYIRSDKNMKKGDKIFFGIGYAILIVLEIAAIIIVIVGDK